MTSFSKLAFCVLLGAFILGCGENYAAEKPQGATLKDANGKPLTKGGKEASSSIADGDIAPAPPGINTGTK